MVTQSMPDSDDNTYQFFATCPKGVEDLLLQECEKFNLPGIKQVVGGVGFEGCLKDAYRMCLWSRLASRVLLRLSVCNPADYDELYAWVQDIDWSEHLSADSNFAIDCFTSHETITNSHFATLKIKDAIVDQFRERTGIRPNIERERPAIRINLYAGRSESILYIDLSGEALHKRGYRQHAGTAPLKENLASAILLRCKWPQIAAEGRPFCDPMCGSGTLLIEAAYIAANIAPGLLRNYYGFTGWKQHDTECWKELYQQAVAAAEDKSAIPPIIGADHSQHIVELARDNIKAAGLEQYITVHQQDASSAMPGLPVKAGLLATNPPYGKRLGQTTQLRNQYYLLGQSFRTNYPGWNVSVFTSSDELAKSIGLRSHHKNTLFNGPLKCTLYHYLVREALPESDSSRNEKTAVHESAGMFENRLKKNIRHIGKWARKNAISCFRVYDADIPQYSLAIDIYDGWVHVQEYEPPKTVNSAVALYRLNDAIAIISDVLEVDRNNIVVKTRKIQSGAEQYERQDEKHHALVVNESGLKFRVNLYDYLDTGLFLDHRNIRKLIYNYCQGKSFLNLFAYTGTATVYAAAGGARSTTTVDMSNVYLEWARENLKLNKLDSRQHEFIRADVLQWLWDANREGRSFQFIFLDPPTFSNSKKMSQTLDISRDHVELIKLSMRLLSDDGMLLFSCNAKRFKLDKDNLADYSIQDISALTTSEDFRRRPQHKSWCLTRQPLAAKLKL